MFRKAIAVVSMCVAALLYGCDGSGHAPASLVGREWLLVSFGPAGTETPVIDGTTVTITFESDGTVHGSSGCNWYGGEYEVHGSDGLSIGALGGTEMYCISPAGVAEQEAAYLSALSAVNGFAAADAVLTLFYGADGRLNFVPRGAMLPD